MWLQANLRQSYALVGDVGAQGGLVKRGVKQVERELEFALTALKQIANANCGDPKEYAFRVVADLFMERAMPEIGRCLRAAMTAEERQRTKEILGKRRADVKADEQWLGVDG